MSRFWDWLRIFGALATASSMIILLGHLAIGLQTALDHQRENNRKLQADAKERQEKASQEIASRCSIGVDRSEEIRVCVAKEIEAYREQNKSSRELEVQQQSANWALGSLAVSFGALVVSAFGLWMLRQSLLYTRAAIGISREIGHAQVRAYLSITPEITVCLPGRKVEATIKVINEGQSPAKNFGYIAYIYMRDHPMPETSWPLIVPAEGQKTPKGVLPPKAEHFCEAISPEILTPEDYRMIRENGKRRLYIAMVAFYSDVFGEDRVSTYCSYVQSEPVLDDPDRKRLNFMSTAFGNEVT
jgi:hypothetical protein